MTRTRTMSIDSLETASYNPRLAMNSAETRELRASLDTFGLVEPLVWNRRTGTLVSGHQRLKVLKARGDKEVLVSEVDLSVDEEKALNVALNREGRWDVEKLETLLDHIDTDELRLTVGLDVPDVPDVPTEPEITTRSLSFIYTETEMKEVKEALRAAGGRGHTEQLMNLVRGR